MKRCRWCGQSFGPPHHRGRLFCSNECARKARRAVTYVRRLLDPPDPVAIAAEMQAALEQSRSVE